MTERHSAVRYAAVAIALTDNLIALLKARGIIDDSDRAKIISETYAGLKSATNADISGAVELLREMYKEP